MTRTECKLAIENFEQVRKIGELQIRLPEPPRWNEIANFDLPKNKQFFPYIEIPKLINEEFLEDFSEKCAKGFWFYCNGNLEYISDTHFFLLNLWKDKGRQLLFVDAQRDVYLWWAAIEGKLECINIQSKNLAGGNLATNRRFGKSTIGNCILYKRTTDGKYRRGGIQSKTDNDAKTLFGKLVSSWTQLPEFAKPNDTGQSRPSSILEFSTDRQKKGNNIEAYADALHSTIDYKASVEEAYDGEELYTIIEDEVGKTKNVNTDIRYYILRFCLQKGSYINGKDFRTTTVEDMEKKGGANFKKTWDASKIATLNEKTGRTESYLTNLFIPADYGYIGEHPVTGVKFVDEYGYSNREAAKEFILSLWEGKAGSDLAALQQKDPLTERHMWQMKNTGGCFKNELLQIQRDYLEGNNPDPADNAPKSLVRQVTFYRDGSGVVRWRDDPHGHFQMVWDFANTDDRNKRKLSVNGFWEPANTQSFVIGVDPIGATMTTGTEKSQAIAYVFRKGDLDDPDNSGLCVLRYAPPRSTIRSKKDFHRNIMILCEYYGCKANYESNIDDYYQEFIDEGFRNYVMWRPKITIDPMRKNVVTKYGTPSNDPFSLQKQLDVADEYITFNYFKIYFLELIKSLMDFDKDDRTKSDDSIAFFMVLIGSTSRKTDQPTKSLSGLNILPFVNKEKHVQSGTKLWKQK